MIQYLWMFASILVIEQGAYINEQGRNGAFYYSNFYLLLFYIASIISFIFFFQFFNKVLSISFPEFKFLKKKEISMSRFFAIMVIIIAMVSLISSPSVYTSSAVNKFNYWEKATFPGLSVILGSTIGYLPFVFGLIYHKYKKCTIVLIIIYIIYLIGVDQKFTAFLYGSLGFLLSFSILKLKNDKSYNILAFKKRYLIFVGTLIFLLVFIKYSNNNPFAYLDLTPMESVFYRAFGLQAHVFWGVVESYIYSNNSHSWDLSELPYGMHVVMKEFTPIEHQKYLEDYVWAKGVSWTNAYPAILIRMFPVPISLVFHFIIFSFVPLIYVILLKTIQNRNYLIAIILFQLTLWLTNIYSMAYFHRLFKVVFIFLFLCFLAYIVNEVKKKRRKIG